MRVFLIVECDVDIDRFGVDDVVSEFFCVLFGGEVIGGTSWNSSREDLKSWWFLRGLNIYDVEVKLWVEWMLYCMIWVCVCGDGSGDGVMFVWEGVNARCVAVV